MNILIVSLQTRPEDGGAHSFQDIIVDSLKKTSSKHQLFFADVKPGEKTLNQKINSLNIDFVWFLFPYYEEIDAPFAITVWDLAHRKHPYFPEVSLSGWTFDARELFYRSTLPKASLIISGSEVLKKEIYDYYGVPLSNIKTIPLPNTSFLNYSERADFPIIHGLKEGDKYLFYPAQFWPHKNHVSLIDAIEILIKKNRFYKLVFCGSDKGNQGYIQDYVFKKGLFDHVIFAGFVSRKNLASLYTHAESLVFGSMFGPDNLPPLEAMNFCCPVICSDYEGASEQLQNAALYFNTLDSADLAEKILRLEESSTREMLIERGRNLLKSKSPINYCQEIFALLDSFSKTRRLWESGNHYRHL